MKGARPPQGHIGTFGPESTKFQKNIITHKNTKFTVYQGHDFHWISSNR
jgi:hypothetical protein